MAYHLSRNLKHTLVSSLLFIGITPVAQATNYTWLGGNGNWNDANWNVSGFPNAVSSNVFIDGGNLLNSAVNLNINASVGALNITAGDALSILDGRSLTLNGGISTNTGTMSLNSLGLYSNVYTLLSLAGDTTLAGSGATVLTNSPYNYIASSNATLRTLTIGNGYTVEGGGNLGINPYVNSTISYLKVVNQGTVKANTSSGLSINVSDSGGTGFDNSAGQIQVANGSSLSLDGGTISGGSIQGTGNSRLSGNGAYKDLTLQGGFKIISGNALYTGVTFNDANTFSNGVIARIAGTITNTGTMSLNASSTYTGFY
ncbi:MAG: hypothetical protein WCP96_21150, partial [Methylococcaceae bacterium]